MSNMQTIKTTIDSIDTFIEQEMVWIVSFGKPERLLKNMKTKAFSPNCLTSVFDDGFAPESLRYAQVKQTGKCRFTVSEFQDGKEKEVLGQNLSIEGAFNKLDLYEREQEAKGSQLKTQGRKFPYYRHVQNLTTPSP